MKKMLLLIGVLSLTVLPVHAEKKTVDIAKFAAGRVRYVEGNSATFTFGKKVMKPDTDYIVLLGAPFETHDSRLELMTLNGNLFWFDRNTDFYVESIDAKTDRSSLFLGKGSFMVETRKPFSLISGSGSVYLPENGTYLVMKNAFGKDKVYVTTLKGTKPQIIKKSTIFSRIKLEPRENKALTQWVTARKKDWKRTLVRADVFSHVDTMPPYMAYTGADGKIHWKKVTSVVPIYRMNGIVEGNWFLFNPTVIHAMGLWTPYSTFMTDLDMAMFFATNRYNSIRWAWNVNNGWHAEWYYDPLAGFGADHRGPNPFFWGRGLAYCAMWSDYRVGWFGGDFYDHGVNVTGMQRMLAHAYQQRTPITSRVTLAPRDSRVRRVGSSFIGKLRMRTDTAMRSDRQARRLDISNAQITRARERIISRERTRARAGARHGGTYSRFGSGMPSGLIQSNTPASISSTSSRAGEGMAPAPRIRVTTAPRH